MTKVDVAPALSAEEWKQLEIPFAGNIYQERMLGVFVEDGWRYKMAKVIALANAGMPDESPHKITRDDVERLREAMTMPCYSTLHALEPIAKKLAALLPPE